MNPSAPGRKCQHTASFSALPTPAAAAESPRSSSVVDGDSHDTSICALEEARRSFDPFRPSRDDNAERSSFPEEVEDGATLVSQFGSEQATYSAEDSSVRLHVRPGCLKKGQVAGPIVIETSKKILVECEGLMYLVSVVVNCQPSGSEFRVPLAMDFRLGERMEEHDKGHAESYLEEVKGDLRESYKVSCSVGLTYAKL